MTEFKDKMCACKDKACSDKVNDEMMKWGQEQAKNAGDKAAMTDGEEAKKVAAVSEEFSKCLTKISTDAMGAAGAGAAGGAAPAAGGAAPAAGDGSAAPAAAGGAAPAAGDGSAAPAAGSADGSAAK